ncbi:MAG: FkbM family methyltransferase [Candidatus Odinarchaeota archaeon]
MKTLMLPNGEKIYYIDRLSALDIYEEIYIEKDYLQFGIKVNDNDVIFDIGANIGLFSRFITQQARNLRIFAFEPVPIIYKVLEANLRNLPANIKTYDIGLAENNRITKIYYYPKVSADSAIRPFDWDLKVNQFIQHYNEMFVEIVPIAKIVPKFLRKFVVKAWLKNNYKSKMVDCTLRTLSDIILENNIECIDLLKIDAENYEQEVLAGIKEEDWNKIRQISMEIHTHIKDGENLLNEIVEMLKEKSFQVDVDLDSRFVIMGVFMLYAKKV